ncbi:hypothetical protein COOONC_19728 [Cooperia oncophora]
MVGYRASSRRELLLELQLRHDYNSAFQMTAKLLNDALLTMHQQHQFGQLCTSSLLPTNEESSYATYCDNNLGVPCLGDEFSVNWMEDSDEVSLRLFP